MSYNELNRHKKRVAFVSNTSSFTGWSDNFGAKWQLWCQSDDFNQKVWVAMHGVGWRVKKVMTSVCWHHHVENVRKDRCPSMRRHRFSMWDTYVPTCYLREYTYRSDIFGWSDETWFILAILAHVGVWQAAGGTLGAFWAHFRHDWPAGACCGPNMIHFGHSGTCWCVRS